MLQSLACDCIEAWFIGGGEGGGHVKSHEHLLLLPDLEYKYPNCLKAIPSHVRKNCSCPEVPTNTQLEILSMTFIYSLTRCWRSAPYFLRDPENTNRRRIVHERIWQDGEKQGQGQTAVNVSLRKNLTSRWCTAELVPSNIEWENWLRSSFCSYC